MRKCLEICLAQSLVTEILIFFPSSNSCLNHFKRELVRKILSQEDYYGKIIINKIFQQTEMPDRVIF